MNGPGSGGPDVSLFDSGPASGGLATRIIFVVFLSTFLTAVLVSWISVYSTHTFLRDKLSRTFPAAVASAADRTANWLDDASGELEQLASAGSSLEENATLAQRLRESPHFEALILTDPDGRVVSRAGNAAGLVPSVATGVWVGEDAEGIPHVGMGLALDGTAAGSSLHGVYSRSRMRPLLGVAGLSRDGVIHLVADGGQILVSGRLTQTPAPHTRLPLEQLSDGVVSFSGPGAERRIGTAGSIPGTNLSLVVEEPYEAAFEPVFDMVKRVFVIDLGILILFSLVAHRVTSAMVRPIEALSEGARRISQGELDVELVESEARDEIGLLTRTFNDMTRKLLSHRVEIERANHKLVAQNAELQRANEVLEQLSITDGLTRLHNHRFFQDHLTREIKRVSRTSENLSMLMCDIDDFKRLNDRLGHAAGDELLAGIAGVLDESVRETDFLARYGGEEFVVLCPDTDLAGAIHVAEKIRSCVAEGSFILDGSSQLSKITISIGVAQFEGSRRSFFQAADQALYRAKGAGKNCVKSAREVPGYPDL
ncbi:MAG: diguanylate cyclase [Myxococcota bacterium]